MPHEQTNKTDTERKEDNNNMENSNENKTPSQILKEENDNLQKELERAQKIRNEALLAGTAGGRVESKPIPEITAEEYANKLKRGEVNPLGDDGISI